jgi:hypothetical protein
VTTHQHCYCTTSSIGSMIPSSRELQRDKNNKTGQPFKNNQVAAHCEPTRSMNDNNLASHYKDSQHVPLNISRLLIRTTQLALADLRCCLGRRVCWLLVLYVRAGEGD